MKTLKKADSRTSTNLIALFLLLLAAGGSGALSVYLTQDYCLLRESFRK
jgi:hypothetical protein